MQKTRDTHAFSNSWNYRGKPHRVRPAHYGNDTIHHPTVSTNATVCTVHRFPTTFSAPPASKLTSDSWRVSIPFIHRIQMIKDRQVATRRSSFGWADRYGPLVVGSRKLVAVLRWESRRTFFIFELRLYLGNETSHEARFDTVNGVVHCSKGFGYRRSSFVFCLFQSLYWRPTLS